jgi:hypothetical protein
MPYQVTQKDCIQKAWPTYVKAFSFLLPPIVVFSVAAIFVIPKIKQMCADVGYDPRPIFSPIDLVMNQGWLFLGAIVALLFVLEKCVPFWRRHRSTFTALLVFFLNSAVLVELVCILFVAAIVGPQMNRIR